EINQPTITISKAPIVPGKKLPKVSVMLFKKLFTYSIVIVGWFISGLLRKLTVRLIKSTGLDKHDKNENIDLPKFIGKLVYFLVMIFVFMLALEKLGMQSVLDPVKNLLDGFLAYIPNIIGAGLVGYIGYMLAKVVSELVSMSGETLKKLTAKAGFSAEMDLVGILKRVVFIFIFIPLVISALNILNMSAISEPATAILEQFFAAIPKVLTAALVLIIFIVGGKYLTQLIQDLLSKLNLDAFVEKMYLKQMLGNLNLSSVIANIIYFFIVTFGLLTAIEKLEFKQLTAILDSVTQLSGKILFGLVIILIGNFISVLAKNAIPKSDNNSFVASVVRVAVLAIFLAIGLKTMGMADDIVNLAFGITLGTVALTVILSFGLGGREAAGRQMENILNKFNSKD
ncbi:MAG: mechanosensitive ion channel, partial [Bacteroidota bacterium]